MRHLICLLFTLMLSLQLQAQSAITLTYGSGFFQSTELKEFIDKPSWTGFVFDYQFFITDKFTLGFRGGYQSFFEKRERSNYTQDNTTINAITWRYLNSAPLLASADYYFTSNVTVIPFIGGGIGLNIISQELQFGDLLLSEKKFPFSTFVEAGILFSLNDDFAINLEAGYNYSLYKPEKFDLQNAGIWHAAIGFVFIN